MWAEYVTSDLLDCNIDIIPVVPIVVPSVVVISLVLLVAALCFIFRYEIMIGMRKWRRQRIKDRVCENVFVSFFERDMDALLFVGNYLKPGLIGAGYTLNIPRFEGMATEDEISVKINRCIHYVVVLTKDYLDKYEGRFEFDCIWKNFNSNRSKQLIIINLDFIDSKSITDKRINSFRRVEKDISFRERHATLLARLKERLGVPLVKGNAVKPLDGFANQRGGDEPEPKPEIPLEAFKFARKAITHNTNTNKVTVYIPQSEQEDKLIKYFSKPVHVRLSEERPKFRN